MKTLCAVTLLLLSVVCFSQTIIPVVSYPNSDASGGGGQAGNGWSFTGTFQNWGCVGPCSVYNVPDNNGNDTGHQRLIYGNWEPEGPFGTMYMRQSNCGDSFATLTFNVPTAGSYYVAAQVHGNKIQAPAGCTNGVAYWPTVSVASNGAFTLVCYYPNLIHTPLQCDSELTVDNAGHTNFLPEYLIFEPSLFAGSNTISIQLNGGSLHGGSLDLGGVVIYAASGGNYKEQCGCRDSAQVWHSSQQTGTNPWGMNNACRSWATSTCGSGSAFNNLAGSTVGANGCGTGSNKCRMFDVD